jgi:hypothetical protein
MQVVAEAPMVERATVAPHATLEAAARATRVASMAEGRRAMRA